jgi:hypothetical protein
MYSGESTRALPRVGFPIRKSRDHRLVSTFPGLIAAAHVLHRLLAPRHPPYALVLLIVKNTLLVSTMEFSRCARTDVREKIRPEDGLSKLNSARRTKCRGRRSSRRARTSDGLGPGVTSHSSDHHWPSNESSAYRSNGSGIPRKEVIQPQLPLRLPCYDFTPIIDPTFDGSLPCGLGHRLRVLPTFVV